MNSANTDDWDEIHDRIAAGAVDLLVVSPERLNSPGFDEVLRGSPPRSSLLVVDEAHCISDWGHDFRPTTAIRDVLADLGDVPVSRTATANVTWWPTWPSSWGRILSSSGATSTARRCTCSVLETKPAERLAGWPSSATYPVGHRVHPAVAATETVAMAAGRRTCRVRLLGGATDAAERERIEQALRANELRAVVATSALGRVRQGRRGVRGPPGRPPSPIAYYQQVGRAGRAVDRAEVVLLPGAEDQAVWAWFDSTAFPPEGLMRQVLDELEADGGTVATAALEHRVNLGRSRLEGLLKVLDVDGAVEQVRGGWRPTGKPWAYDTERYRRVAATRRPSSRRCSTTSPPADAGCGSCGPSSTTRSSTPTAGAATAAPAERPSPCPPT